MEKFHEKLKMLRKKEGFTQQEVADFFGIQQAVYQKWENGKCKPSYEKLEKIADFFEISLDWLFGRDK